MSFFEKIFSKKNEEPDLDKEQTEEQTEKMFYKIIGKELSDGVNAPAIFRAFDSIKKENESNNYGFTNNRLLNMVKNYALGSFSDFERISMGGSENVINRITSEIENLRQSLSDEEKKS